jgi:hypothetical protein
VLTQKIATDNLADAFMAFNTNYHDTGLFGVYAVTDRERSGDLSWVVMNEVRGLGCDNTLSTRSPLELRDVYLDCSAPSLSSACPLCIHVTLAALWDTSQLTTYTQAGLSTRTILVV